ncbi:hypothetical protein EJB05_53904, partial [Eragrostis curvula]
CKHYTTAIENNLAIRIDEGRPVIPIQAAKFATEGGMVLRQHIPVLPNWKEYKMDPSYVCDYISKVSRDKYKDEDPTPLELFKEFHSSQKTGFISKPVQKAIDHMEAMMGNPVEEGQEPPSTESTVCEVVRSNTFLRAVGISPKKRSRVSRSCQFQDLMRGLYLEKVRRDALRETIKQQNLQLADLRKISVEATEARRTTTAQLEAFRKEAARKAEMIQSFRMVLGVEGQVHPSLLVSE